MSVRNSIRNSEITSFLAKQYSSRNDLKEIQLALEEFFLNTSEFVLAKSENRFPEGYLPVSKENEFILEKKSTKFLYSIEASHLNDKFFGRVKFKIAPLKFIDQPTLTLFLINESCY